MFPNLSITILKSLSKVLALNPCFSFTIEDLDILKSFRMWSQKEFHEECDSQAMQWILYFIRDKEQLVYHIILHLPRRRLKSTQGEK